MTLEHFKNNLSFFKTLLLTTAGGVKIHCPPFQYPEKHLSHEIPHVLAIQASVTRDVAERTFWDKQPGRSICAILDGRKVMASTLARS
jgi:hypothetical protein